jgi:hypothetical protein
MLVTTYQTTQWHKEAIKLILTAVSTSYLSKNVTISKYSYWTTFADSGFHTYQLLRVLCHDCDVNTWAEIKQV